MSEIKGTNYFDNNSFLNKKNKRDKYPLNHKGTKRDKPIVKLIGTDGNVFSIIGKVAKGLKDKGLDTEARDFRTLAMEQSSYGDVLSLASEYVEIR